MDVSTLEEHGADPERIRFFGQETPELVPYVTLLRARQTDPDLAALHGVYEWLHSPLIFLIDGDSLDEAQLRRIRRMIALRGDAPYIGVVQPGRLTVHRVALDDDSPQQSRIDLPPHERRATFAWLGNMRPDAAPGGAKHAWISDVVLRLLGESIDALTSLQISSDDALSLTGRALFIRFLGDRNLLPSKMEPAHMLFANAARAEDTSLWLDKTFNGDFLPLTPGLFATLPKPAFHALGNILCRAERGQLHLGWEHKWDFLDFAHIPVGVLSQAYEHHLRNYAPQQQRKEGVYYTPPVIADWMVSGAFHALRREGVAHTARVLDPAAGAGVFLLTVFRQLVAERWAVDGKRPDTATLRKILYEQLVGFDINESALRLAALGLYLMSIELDPDPRPVRNKLRFKNLRGSVLLKTSDDAGNAPARGLGSLGPAVGPEYAGQFDLVIGNPPWTSSTKLPGWSEVEKIVARIARERLPDHAPAPPLPNESLDLPFVWRAMEWARPAGQIALALSAGLLFQQGAGMPRARSAIFDALDVTGVLNGTALRETNVWPRSRAPFCLLFARNRRPPAGAGFRFISPHLEDELNRAGGLRVDANSAAIVTSQQIAERPEIFKILFRGTALDLEIIERMSSRAPVTLEDYWRSVFESHRGKPRQAGNGYQKLRDSTTRPQPAHDLGEIPHLEYEGRLPLFIKTDELPLFKEQFPDPEGIFLHRRRNRAIYRAPLLIIHKSPPAESGRIGAAVADDDVIFNETYYGFSAHGYADAARLVRYLMLLLGSKVALWHVLMTSGEFGFEREKVELSTINRVPVLPLEQLDRAARRQIDALFKAVVRDDTEQTWRRVDAWVASLYGLRERDVQVINDTLEFNLPFAHNRVAAQAPVSPEQMSSFCTVLADELAPWAQDGQTIEACPMSTHSGWPWEVVRVRAMRRKARAKVSYPHWPEVLRIADELGATEVVHPDPSAGGLWIARLRHARYWSHSQARLVARQIVWEHPDMLALRGDG